MEGACDEDGSNESDGLTEGRLLGIKLGFEDVEGILDGELLGSVLGEVEKVPQASST